MPVTHEPGCSSGQVPAQSLGWRLVVCSRGKIGELRVCLPMKVWGALRQPWDSRPEFWALGVGHCGGVKGLGLGSYRSCRGPSNTGLEGTPGLWTQLSVMPRGPEEQFWAGGAQESSDGSERLLWAGGTGDGAGTELLAKDLLVLGDLDAG